MLIAWKLYVIDYYDYYKWSRWYWYVIYSIIYIYSNNYSNFIICIWNFEQYKMYLCIDHYIRVYKWFNQGKYLSLTCQNMLLVKWIIISSIYWKFLIIIFYWYLIFQVVVVTDQVDKPLQLAKTLQLWNRPMLAIHRNTSSYSTNQTLMVFLVGITSSILLRHLFILLGLYCGIFY